MHLQTFQRLQSAVVNRKLDPQPSHSKRDKTVLERACIVTQLGKINIFALQKHKCFP